jgi:uncharacterized membrane protein
MSLILFAVIFFFAYGLSLYFFPPKKMQLLGRGVALPEARRSAETWETANKYAGVLLMIGAICYGIIYLLIALGVLRETISLFASVTLAFALILRALILKRLRDHFDPSGNSKS